MIIKIALILLYLVVGLWLFVAAVTFMGGKKAAYDSNLVFTVSLLMVVIFWPVFVIQTFFQRRK